MRQKGRGNQVSVGWASFISCLPCAPSLQECRHDLGGDITFMGFSAHPAVCGSDLCVAFPIPLGKVVLSKADGKGGQTAERAA